MTTLPPSPLHPLCENLCVCISLSNTASLMANVLYCSCELHDVHILHADVNRIISNLNDVPVVLTEPACQTQYSTLKGSVKTGTS